MIYNNLLLKRYYSLWLLPLLILLTSCQSQKTHLENILSENAINGTWAGTVFYSVNGDTILNTNSFYINPDGDKTHKDHPVALASLTKLLTATMILYYVEKGEIFLDAPLAKYRPDMQNTYADFITIRQLLSHRAGLPREINGMSENSFVQFDEMDNAGAWLDTTLVEWDGNPEEEKEYSNLGYWYLGAVLENVTGKSIPMLFRDFYSYRVGMESLTLEPERVVVGRNMDGSPITDPPNLKARYTSGGFTCKVSDFTLFTQKLMEGKILGEEGLNLLFNDFGFEPRKKTPYLQAAHVPGFSHLLVLDKKRNLTLLLTNNKTISPLDAVLDMGSALYETVAKSTLIEKKESEKMVFKHINRWGEATHPLSEAILAMANAIGTANPDSIESIMFKYYDLDEFGPKEREKDLELLPKLPGAMGGWSVRAFREAEMDGTNWIFLLIRPDEEISDTDADIQFTLGMASLPENPDKVFHVFYNFMGFKVK